MQTSKQMGNGDEEKEGEEEGEGGRQASFRRRLVSAFGGHCWGDDCRHTVSWWWWMRPAAATINQDIRFLRQCDSPVVLCVCVSACALFVLMLAPNKCAKTKQSKHRCRDASACNSVQTQQPRTSVQCTADADAVVLFPLPIRQLCFCNSDAPTVYRHYLLIFGHDSCSYWNLFYCQQCLCVCVSVCVHLLFLLRCERVAKQRAAPNSNWTSLGLALSVLVSFSLSLLAPQWLSSIGTVGLSLFVCVFVPLFTIRIYFGVYVKLSCLPMFVRALLCQFILLHHSPAEPYLRRCTVQFIIIALSLLGKVFWFGSIWIFTHTQSSSATAALPHTHILTQCHDAEPI